MGVVFSEHHATKYFFSGAVIPILRAGRHLGESEFTVYVSATQMVSIGLLAAPSLICGWHKLDDGKGMTVAAIRLIAVRGALLPTRQQIQIKNHVALNIAFNAS